MLVLRDFIQLTKWELGSSNSNLGVEWIFSIPDESNLDFIKLNQMFPFKIDKKKSIIYFVVTFYYYNV